MGEKYLVTGLLIISVLTGSSYQDNWAAKDYSYRRNMKLENKTQPDLKNGDVVIVKINPTYLFGDKIKPDFSDLRLYHKSKEVPYSLNKKGKNEFYICFELEEPVVKKGADASYFLYYGNPSAASPIYPKITAPFEKELSFDSDDDLKLLKVDKGIKCKVTGGNLAIEFAPKGSTIRFKDTSELKDFSVKLNLKFPQLMGHAVVMQAGVGLCYEKTTKVTDELVKKIETLVKELDDDDPQKREVATEKLIEIGPSIRSILEGHLSKQTAPEVKWRLEHILEELSKRYNKYKVEVRGGHYHQFVYTEFHVDGTKINAPNGWIYQQGSSCEMVLKFGTSKVTYTLGQQKFDKDFTGEVNQVAVVFYEDVKDLEIGSLLVIRETGSGSTYTPTTEIDIEEKR